MDDVTRTQMRLLVLVVLAFLPAVVIYGFASANLEEHELAQQEQEILQFAHVASVEYERLVEESRHLLGALAEFPEIRDGVQPACGRRLRSVLEHTPQYTTLSLIGRDGYLACGSLTVDGDLFLGDRAYYLLATTQGRFSVGEYAIGRITGKPTVGVAYPIADDSETQIQRVLAASLDLSLLGSSAKRMRLPEFATYTILDRAGNVLVRTPSGKHPLGYDTVGARAPETFPELRMEGDDPTLVSGTDLDGVDRLFAMVPLRSGGRQPEGYLMVGKEEMMLLASAEESVNGELRFLGIAGGVILLLTWLFGHYGLVRARPETGTT